MHFTPLHYLVSMNLVELGADEMCNRVGHRRHPELLLVNSLQPSLAHVTHYLENILNNDGVNSYFV